MGLFSVCSYEALRLLVCGQFKVQPSKKCHEPTPKTCSLFKVRQCVYVWDCRNVHRLPEHSQTPMHKHLECCVCARHCASISTKTSQQGPPIQEYCCGTEVSCILTASCLRLKASILPLENRRTCHQVLRGYRFRFKFAYLFPVLTRNGICFP